jgi:urea transport system ATP-binding protein
MSGALLEVNGISVSFDGFKAINSLSFNIDNGELRAIIGPNGAGKTTFMDIITGKTRPDSGDVIWGEKNISLIRKSESEIANLGVGRKFQKPTIFEDQSVMENLIMALKNNRSPLSVLFYKYNKIDHNKVVNIASDIGLISVLDKLSGELSHGQKQWLEIGMLLAQEPQLLLIDEPAAGMTLEERKHTVLLLKRLSKTRAVVVVEHDMEFIRNLSCKVNVLHEGAVLAEGTLDHVVKNKTVIDVYLGR